jgi:serine/threonine-protein kinase
MRDPGPDLLVGGKYRLTSRLALGGMGEVWVARNLSTGADVAVKMCRGAVAPDEAVARFRQEARLGAMLSHRSIVRIFDLIEDSDGTLLLVMELLRGETLGRHLQRRGPLACEEAIAIALPILSALAHAHDCGIVHRDVTPANIFLAVDPDGHVIPKLVDFGIAKLPAAEFRTVDGRALGTPQYMSPEQIRAQGEIDARSDLFSVAVILYEMMTGAGPFSASSASASLAAVLESVVDPDPRIEPMVWIELQRALAKRPYERHANAREMADALRLALGESEANLEQRLRRSIPVRELAAESDTGRSTRSVGGHSVASVDSARRKARPGWLVGAALAVGLAAVGMVVVRQASKGSAAPAAPASAGVASALGPPPAVAAPAVREPAPPPAAASELVPAPAPTGSNPARIPPHHRRPRPVGMTPGF